MASHPREPTLSRHRSVLSCAVALALIPSSVLAAPDQPAPVEPVADEPPNPVPEAPLPTVSPIAEPEPHDEGKPTPAVGPTPNPFVAEPPAPSPSAISPAPSPPPAVSEAPLVTTPDAAPQDGALVAARMVGTEMNDAGLYFATYGSVVSVAAGLYASSDAGISLALAIGAIVNLSVGGTLLALGKRRMQATDQWLDGRPGRRARFVAKARQRHLSLMPERFAGDSKPIVQRGTRLRETGVGVLIGGGVLNGVAVSVSWVAPGIGIGLNVAGWAAVVTGAVLAARGKKMMFRPYDYGGERVPLAVVPTVHAGADGRQVAGVAVAGRW